MAYIRVKRVKGIPYRYLVEGRRVGGKVVQMVIKYLGPVRGPGRARIYYLTAGDVKEMHVRLIERFGGNKGVINEGYLDFICDSAVARHEAAAGHVERLARKAAHIMFGIITRHPFIDGNKRVGYAASRTFLRMNGYTVRCRDDEAVSIAKGISSGQVKSEAEVADWLGMRLWKARI